MNARVRALAVLVAVFLLGFSAGFGVYHVMRVPAASGANRPSVRDRGGQRLPDRLQLSPDQRAQFESIVKEFRPQFDAVRAEERKKLDPIQAEVAPKFDQVRAEMAPKFDAVRAEMNRRIAAILNADQRKQFDSFQKDREGRGGPSGRHWPEHPGPPPDPR
jgi:Spy/CpxP family protein refolding chaperone